MDQMGGTTNGRVSLRTELAEIRRSLKSSSSDNDSNDVEDASLWAAIERLPTFERVRSSVFDDISSRGEVKEKGRRVVDVTKLDDQERHLFVHKLIKHVESDNLKLLRKVRERIDRVGVTFPSVEVKYKNVHIEAECEVVHGKAIPTLWNSLRTKLYDIIKFCGAKSHEAKIDIIEDASGVIKPGRLTLLLGPPGCGKTTLLKALSGNLDKSLKMSGEICYNGHKLEEFVPQKTSAYISQNELHIAQMTVRETLDFSTRCQGIGSRADLMKEIIKREKEQGIIPDSDVDTYMKILGLDICAETLTGDAMRRGISGGQKKRLTIGEMIVGPKRVLLMDEITNGLDSSTAFQIVSCLQHLAHFTDATLLVSLLQPAPETFDLFDDLILMVQKKIIYHGPRDQVLQFFENCGFKCPERKNVADFLQEVVSKKDQPQYWYRHDEARYTYVSNNTFCRMFKSSSLGRKLDEEVSQPYDDKTKSKRNVSSSLGVDSVSKWQVFKACASREFLLMKRNSFVYVFKTSQLFFLASIAMTVFLRSQMKVDLQHANYYMGALFYGLIMLVFNAVPELALTVQRLEVFYKQKELKFYPAWAYAIPAAILKIPFSLVQALVWTSLTYYVIGYTPEFSRFFRHFLVLFAVNILSLSMFRLLASVIRSIDVAPSISSFTLLLILTFAGFIITHTSMPAWMEWGFWVSPISYGEIGLSINEFLAPRWQKRQSTNTTIGHIILQSRGLDFHQYFYWISLGALFGFAVLFNVGFTLALTFLNSPGSSRAIISYEKLGRAKSSEDCNGGANSVEQQAASPKAAIESSKGRIALPFTPLTVVFRDLHYYVDMPVAMRERGFTQKKLQLLSDITGALRPGILTALMGVSGAGKTTLLDVLAGRKTSGYIEGEIKIGGFPKVQETFARISGYCEQTDIHSSQITVEESLIFSAWLRLASNIDSKTKEQFVNEVLETIELDSIKDSLVGIPGVSGLSTEQRKRLTIAVELVSNPSIIFMDEPTTGLDARAAAIVMRAVKNVVDTGRTIVCTIHQPSIDIFESFDELILLKTGGHVIYYGPLGRHSSKVIEFFEQVPGVSMIRENHNPATWMLEVTSSAAEAKLGIDFAQVYKNSALYKNNKEIVKQLSTPPPGSRDLHFSNVFAQSFAGQFKACLWKQNLSYWRNPCYNLTRILYTIASSLVFGTLFWKHGKKLENQQNLFNNFGSMYSSVNFIGIHNCATVFPNVSRERTVMYRERFAGMYSSWAYSLAQVIIEVPYIFVQAAAFVIITYPMIGYYGSSSKVFWCFYSMFCALLYFNYLGMLLISVTPNFHIASILASAFYSTFNLFAGFLVPKPRIPRWWIWFYYMSPTSWTLNCLLTSQYGDINKTLMVFGERRTVSGFLRDYFGFHHNQLPLVRLILFLFPLLFASLFGLFIGRLNFQRR
ncbi:pleiotropic drug resistance protein 3-like isoform X2 [Momordica charantia]|uniref:Pleiotropic drug resistance protein 3-like isoform X2 n=1 Tax=Momordica charantia TaxID=3673 RepID=A0A6J1DJR4_MOMCH|nr:pleiotropic drug resistance protein 3-like isoform X2 [Momordica charantia]